MPLFINRIGRIVDRFLEYVTSVAHHVYLVITGAILTLAPYGVRWWFPTKTAQVDLRSVFDSLSTPLGLVLLFIATFLAWNEQKDNAEKASPEGLKREVDAIAQELAATKAQLRRILTSQQRDALRTSILAVQQEHGLDYLRVAIYHNWLDADAEDYARQFAEVFIACNASGVPAGTQEVSSNFEGLAIWVKEEHSPPENASLFADALRRAGLNVRFEGFPNLSRVSFTKDTHFEFVVGRRENVNELERRVSELQSHQEGRWQPLTDQQRAQFVALLKELNVTDNRWPYIMLFPDFTRHDSVELAHTLTALCAEANWGAPCFGDTLVRGRERPPGLNIYADGNRPEVQTFMKALRGIGLYPLLRHDDNKDTVEMRIGKRNPY